MTKEQNPTKKYITKSLQLRPADVEHLQEISQGNMSYTVRKLIEDAWKAQAKETK